MMLLSWMGRGCSSLWLQTTLITKARHNNAFHSRRYYYHHHPSSPSCHRDDRTSDHNCAIDLKRIAPVGFDAILNEQYVARSLLVCLVVWLSRREIFSTSSQTCFVRVPGVTEALCYHRKHVALDYYTKPLLCVTFDLSRACMTRDLSAS